MKIYKMILSFLIRKLSNKERIAFFAKQLLGEIKSQGNYDLIYSSVNTFYGSVDILEHDNGDITIGWSHGKKSHDYSIEVNVNKDGELI